MGGRIIKLIFFGNYFVGLLAIVLSIETCIQLRIPFNSGLYYLLLFSTTVMYYTYAYTGALKSASTHNLRSRWYSDNHFFVQFSQWFLLSLGIVSGTIMAVNDYRYVFEIPVGYWLIAVGILLASVLYYGLLPKSFLNLNLRNTGWLKAFVIGFVWAGCVGLVPLVALKAEGISYHADTILVIGLFIKNWMFCTVNAIIFDLKDYEDDSNKQLKTFAVTFGLHRTISYILIPLILIGIVATLAFAGYRHFTWLPILINLVPFFLLLVVSYSMHRQKSIFYYLIVIDGLVMMKGVCGIIAMQFVHT
jgi:hypothetical protein